MTPTIAEKLECVDEIFLGSIVAAYEADDKTIGPETTLAVRGLKQVLRQVRTSNDVDDHECLAAINVNFQQLDGLNYNNDMTPGMPIGKQLTSCLERASRRDTVDFAYWYQNRVIDLGAQLRVDQPLIASDTMERTAALIKASLMPPAALSIMKKVIAWSSSFIPIGSVEQEANLWNGYCHSDGIGLANLYNLPESINSISPLMLQTVYHEYLHGVRYVGGNRVLLDGLTDKDSHLSPNLWLEESYVTNLSRRAILLDHDPNELTNLPNPFPAEREFLDLALGVAANPIDISDLSAAHFSGRSKRTSARLYVFQALSRGFNELYPEFEGNAWNGINQGYESCLHPVDRGEYIQQLCLKGNRRRSATLVAKSAVYECVSLAVV